MEKLVYPSGQDQIYLLRYLATLEKYRDNKRFLVIEKFIKFIYNKDHGNRKENEKFFQQAKG